MLSSGPVLYGKKWLTWPDHNKENGLFTLGQTTFISLTTPSYSYQIKLDLYSKQNHISVTQPEENIVAKQKHQNAAQVHEVKAMHSQL